MVLKLPLTKAASTKGLQRYRGFCIGDVDGELRGRFSPLGEVGKVADVGVGERLVLLGPDRCIERPIEKKDMIPQCSADSSLRVYTL